MKYRETKRLEEKQIADSEVVQEKVNEHLVAYKKQLEQKRRIGRYRLKPLGPRKKEIPDEDTTIPTMNIIIKGDVDGSVEAILDVIETYDSNNECKLDLVHYAVGNITENDIDLAETFNAVIYAFNVQCPEKLVSVVKTKKIHLKYHNVIYKLIDDLKENISAKLPPKSQEEVIGEANVLQQFTVNDGKKKIPVAGCRCTKGMLKKNAFYRLMRANELIHEGNFRNAIKTYHELAKCFNIETRLQKLLECCILG